MVYITARQKTLRKNFKWSAQKYLPDSGRLYLAHCIKLND